MHEQVKGWPLNVFQPAEESVKIYYSSDAYMKIATLVMEHNMEIGWNMTIKPYKDGYKVYDVLVYPQKRTSTDVSVDTGKWALWKANLKAEEDETLFGQGHSHVNMSVYPSGVDMKQQYEEITKLNSGFYLFQIWNKRMEVNSFLYDLDNNLYYDESKIDLEIDLRTSDNKLFVENSYAMIGEKYESE